MRTLSSRELATLAYERGHEFDPGLMPAPDVVEDLLLAGRAGAVVAAPSSYERRRRRERERRAAFAAVPDWFSADDLLAGPLELVCGEPL
jgi:hypothetical protein